MTDKGHESDCDEPQWIYLSPEERQEVQDAQNALWREILDRVPITQDQPGRD